MSNVRFHTSILASTKRRRMDNVKFHVTSSDSILTTEKNKHCESKPESQLFVPLENIVLDYTNSFHAEDKKYFSNAKYDPAQIGSGHLSLFQNRLPVITLLRHAVRGEYNEVDAMLTKNPALLLEKDTIIDFSGRKHVNRSVYQLALGAKDCDVVSNKGNKVVDGMIEMIEKHFHRIPNKTDNEIASIMQKQYDEQYPTEYKEIEIKQDEHDLAAYEAVMNVIYQATNEACRETSELENEIFNIIHKEGSERSKKLSSMAQSILKANDEENFVNAFDALTIYISEKGLIKSDKFDFTVLKAIYRFRNYLEPKHDFTMGKHFNHKLLAKAATDYDGNYDTFGAGFECQWEAPKNCLCWQKIFGYIERFVPACDGQVIAQSLWAVLENGEQSKRSLNWAYGGGKYFPLDSGSVQEVGYNCGGDRGCRATVHGAGYVLASALVVFKIYVEQKLQPRAVTHRRDNQSEKIACVIL